jgi:hypothetical protein
VRGRREEDEREEACAGPVQEMNGCRPVAVVSGVPNRPKKKVSKNLRGGTLHFSPIQSDDNGLDSGQVERKPDLQ